PSFFPNQLNRNLTLLFLRPFTIPVFTTSLAAKVLVSSTAFVETHPTICKQQNLYQWEPVVVEEEDSGSDNVLACPICYDPLTWTVGSPSYVGSKSGSNLQCKTCKKSYFGNQTHLDLVASGGSKQYDNSMPLATELFRTPVVSFLYERGWRQNFIFGGFPGSIMKLFWNIYQNIRIFEASSSYPKVEDRSACLDFEMAKKYLKPVLGGNIVDASCGSGLFSRLFAKSGLFSQVVALDYSENMLRQCYEKRKTSPKMTLVRADISRLPFKSSSVDALHAGAALHCWPSPSTACLLHAGQLQQVLRLGGSLTQTFLHYQKKELLINVMGIAGSHIFLSERELEDLCRTCGLIGFTCIRNSHFVMISARKCN
ncbi:hypothetical protein ERO13_D01G114675v2, partial [Gossypium hirsutum]